MIKKQVEEVLEKYGRIFKASFDEGINTLESIKDDCNKLGAEYEFYRLSILSSAKKKVADTIMYAEKAIDESYKKSNYYMLSEINIFLGIHYRMNNQYEASFKHYLDAAKAIPTPRVYNNIADLYLLIGAYEEAEQFIKLALDLLNKKDEKSLYDIFLHNIICSTQSELDIMAGRYEEAKASASSLLQSAVETEDYIGQGYGFCLLGTIDIQLGDYDNAMDNLEKSENIYLTIDDAVKNQVIGDLEQVIYLEAKCLFEQKKYETSIRKLESLEIPRQRNFELLIDNYETLQDKENANNCYRSFMAFIKEQDNFKQNQQKENFKAAVRSLETEKKANEYELLYSNTKSISEIGKQIISADKLDDVLQAIYYRIDKIMDFDSLILGKADANSIYFNWIIDANERLDPFTVDVRNKNSLSAWVIRNKKSIKINDALSLEEINRYKEVPDINWYGSKMESILIAPIMYKDEVWGLINIQAKGKFKYNEYDLEVINMLASYIGVAMKNWKDTSELIKVNNKLEALSKTDALTGIGNRHVLLEIIEELFRDDGSGNHDISVVMIDIDHFKEYNDSYGHSEGDKCIISIANTLREHLDVGNNRLFRYGGDEFVAIVPFMKDSDLEALLETVRKEIESLSIINERSKVSDYVTCTFGYSTIKKGMKDYQRAFYLADEALYHAKAKGKNCIGYIPDEV